MSGSLRRKPKKGQGSRKERDPQVTGRKKSNSASFKAEWNQIWRWEDLRQEELRSLDLSSPTRDRTYTPCSGNKES